MSKFRRKTMTLLVGMGVMAGVARQAEAQTQTQDIRAAIASALLLTVTRSFTGEWTLQNGVLNDNQANANTQIQLTADANVRYTIRANADVGTKPVAQANRLYEGTAPGVYVATSGVTGGGAPKLIAAALQIQRLTAGAPDPISTDTVNGFRMAGSADQPATPPGGATHDVQLLQQVDFGDTSLAGAGSTTTAYYMVITFTIVPGAV